MATIYDYKTWDELTDGLQAGDEAVRAARQIATDREEPVVLDDDGLYLVYPDGRQEALEVTQ